MIKDELTIKAKDYTAKGFKHYLFRLHQNSYEWGKGWVLSNEAYDNFEREVIKMIKLMGFVPTRSDISSACIEGLASDLGEGIYFHPMDFSGVLSEENFKKAKEIISTFKSDYWIFSEVIAHEMKHYHIDSMKFRSQKKIIKE